MFTPPTAQQLLTLNFNENSLGISPLARDAIHAGLGRVHRYPDAPQAELVAALAERHGVAEEQINLLITC